MVGYNLTGLVANTTGVFSFVKGVNDVLMFGWLGSLFLIALGVVLFSAFVYSTRDSQKSLAASLVICFGFALILRALNLVPDLAVFVTLICAAASMAMLWRKEV